MNIASVISYPEQKVGVVIPPSLNHYSCTHSFFPLETPPLYMYSPRQKQCLPYLLENKLKSSFGHYCSSSQWMCKTVKTREIFKTYSHIQSTMKNKVVKASYSYNSLMDCTSKSRACMYTCNVDVEI